MPSIIDHGIDGLLVAPGNSEQLGYAVGILYNDIDLCRQMGNAGFEKASKNYSRETIYQLLIDTYEKLIG
jgi:glycosyltransferase involved in cell wall biosynthesis